MSEPPKRPERWVKGACDVTRYKVIQGFPGYRVGDDGSVWTCWVSGARPARMGAVWRRRKPRRARNGYLQLVTSDRREPLVHRLVLEAFVGPCPEGMEACHADGNRTNNALSNLRWDTPKANAADRERHGKTYRGERIRLAKLTPERVLQIRAEYAAGTPHRHLAARHGVNESTTRAIIAGRAWRHVT